MLDINRNGKIDPEEDALADIMTEEISYQGKKNRSLIIMGILGGILLVILIAALICFSK